MPYTLMKALLWLVLALVIGFSVGWLLRSLVAHRQVARARSQRVDTAEVERLRGRVANLESVVAERDRLAAELAVARGDPPDQPETMASVGAGGPAGRAMAPLADTSGCDVAAVESPTVADRAGPGDRRPDGDRADDGDAAQGTEAPESSPAPADIATAVEVIGHPIELDDLKVVEGIGPKIEELCHGIGIRTWFDLASTEVSLLRTMLNDAGARYKMHDPSTWPQQADLLARGRWAEFVELMGDRDRDKATRS